MKEQIYTIPVSEAYESDSECPLCTLEKKLENEALEYALGAAMMEPDYRILSNEKGYCSKHFERLLAMPNKLSLALVLETHLEEIRKKLDELNADTSRLGKSGLFKKSDNKQILIEHAEKLHKINSECIICDKITSTMERYIDVLLYMWKNDESFRKKFDASNGLCMHHFEQVLKLAPKSLKESDCAQFCKSLYEKQIAEYERLQNDIHRFILKFDYRNKDMEWGTAEDAPSRVLQKIGGWVREE